MGFWGGFVIGLFLGALIGIFGISLVSTNDINRDDNDYYNDDDYNDNDLI